MAGLSPVSLACDSRYRAAISRPSSPFFLPLSRGEARNETWLSRSFAVIVWEELFFCALAEIADNKIIAVDR
ncbi:MAG: hypothetical protein HZB98_06365 [Bacteroidia bacterium]|nr:hypothetical protein [Bacteroidia bacterium]